MAILSQTGQTAYTVTITCSGLDGAHSRTRYFWWQIYRGSTMVSEHGSTMAPGGTSHSTMFSGLDDGTTYTVYCGIYDDSSYQTLLASLSCSAYTNVATFYCYRYRGYNGQEYYYDDFSFTPGQYYYPLNNIPPAPPGYEFDHAVFYGETISPYVVTGGVTLPEEDCGVTYYYTEMPQSNAYIWDGSEWKQATPYIWDGSEWKPATASIWDGSQWKP